MNGNEVLKVLNVVSRAVLDGLANSNSPHVNHQVVQNCQNVVRIGDEVAKCVNTVCRTLDTSYVTTVN